MVPHQREEQAGSPQTTQRHSRIHWTVISIAVIASIAFAFTAILILINEGISHGAITLTILSIIFGVVIGLLGLVFNFLQWLNSRPSSSSNSSTAFVSSSQSFSSGQVSSSSLPYQPLPLSPQTTPPGIMEVSSTPAPLSTPQPEQVVKLLREDWGEAPHTEQFYGREKELAELEQWIIGDGCRLVALLGIGGIGKTALAAKLIDQIKDKFEYVFWRSLQNAPPLETILKNCMQFFSNQQRIDLPENLEDQITLLIQYLRDYRCLLVLDNMETILQAGNRASQYRQGYEGYGRLIQRLGEAKHHSCLSLTSREKPKEVVQLEGKTSSVRSLPLSGLKQRDGQKLLKDKELFGTHEAWADLIGLYSGNPLNLKLASEPIQELFGGDIAGFLKRGKAVFGDIRDPLDLQFTRLSDLEREIMYWLAIEREAISLDELREDMVLPVPEGDLLVALASLRRRSMIESSGTASFTLQPVIMEHVIDSFVERIAEEIEDEIIGLFGSHALIKAQAKDYVRDSQIRVILKPIAERLLSTLGKERTEKKLKDKLATLREIQPQKARYGAGNILNLLVQLKSDLRGYDFSHLPVWQAYLRNISLAEVNFACADLTKSVFTDTFASIYSVSFSPNGQLLAVGIDNGEVWIWQVSDGTLIQICQGHIDEVRSVAFSPDGRTLASGSVDQTIRLWEVSTGNCLKILQGHTNWIRSVTFSPDGNILASSSQDKTIRLWEANCGNCLNILREHTSWVRSVTFNPDSKILASGSDDQTIRLWEVSTGNCLKILQGHTNHVCSVAFSPDGRTLVSGSYDKSVRLWDTRTGNHLKTLLGHTNWIWSVAFSPEGRTIASGSDDQTVRLWEVSTGNCFKILQGHINRVRSVAFSPNGRILASGSDDQTLRLWEVNSGSCLKILQGYTNWVRGVAFSPNGRILVSGSDDQTVRLWEVSTGNCLKILRGHINRVRGVAFSPDGGILASGSEDQTVRLWEVSTGNCLKILHGHTDWVYSVAFSPDGGILASGSEDQTVRLWEVSTGNCLKTLRDHTSWVWSVAFSPDGKLLATGSEDQTVRLWELSTGECLKILQEHINRVWSIAFSFDGKLLATASDEQDVHLWAVNTGSCLTTLSGHTSWVYSVAFSTDGGILASGSENQVRLWDVSTGQCLKTLQGHTSWVHSVAFSPDGTTIASGSRDGTLKLWNMHTGACLKTLRSDRPYERMNITGVTGLTEAQKATLSALGAVEDQG